MASICLSLTQPKLDANLRCAEEQAAWIDMLELRADFLEPEELKAAATFPERLTGHLGRELPTILTLRRPADGGRFAGSEDERRELLGRALRGGFSYIDLEDDVYEEAPTPAVLKQAQERGIRLIRSIHDFIGTPDGLVPTMLRMGRHGEIPKMAVTPRNSGDLLALFHAYDALAGRPFVLLGMGQVGVPSRVLCLAYGAAWTYASAPDARAAAPGHTTPRELVESYAAAACSRDSAVFGVVGAPIGHSKSPEFHNAQFRARGADAVYLPFEAQDFERFMGLAEYMGVRGLSVTIPHKGDAAAWAARSAGADPAVAATGACNTLLRGAAAGGAVPRSSAAASVPSPPPAPRWRGVNTDIVGFLAPLEAATAGEGFPARAVVVGAGGVARAAVYALVERGLSVLLLNRTLARAQELADTINRAFGPASGSDAPTGSRTGSESTPQEGSSPEPAEGPVIAAALGPDSAELMQAYAGLIVQTTRVGMTPDEDADPVSFYEFTGTETVYDLVYTPERTRLLGRAAAAGCRTVSGKDMFIRQAEEQARLFAELLAPP